MNLSNHTTSIAAGAVLFSAMALVGWQVQRGDHQTGAEARIQIRESRSSSRIDRPSTQRNGLAAAKRMLRAIQAEKNPAERMRATTALVNSLSPEELLEWMDKRWFTCRDGFDLTLFSRLATERLSHEDPIGLLAWSMKDGSTGWEASLQTLTKSDPQALLDFFRENPNSNIELRALAVVAETNPGLAVDRLIELSLSGHDMNSYQMGQTMLALAKSSPEQLEGALDSLAGKAGETAEAALLGVKLNRSFGTEIQNLIAQPDGLSRLKAAWQTSRTDLADTLLVNLGQLPSAWQAELSNNSSYFLDNKNASQWLAADLEGTGLTSQQADNIRMTCIQNLSYYNPKQALQGFLDLDRTSMNEVNRNSTLQSIFSNQRNLMSATGLINMLDNETDREFARQVIQSSNDSNPNSLRTASTAQEWLKKVDSVSSSPDSSNSYYLIQAVQSLNKHQLTQLGKDFENLPSESQRNVAQILASTSPFGDYEVDPNLKGQAITFLISNPEDEKQTHSNPRANSSALASKHVAQWAQTDPVAASAWTSKLPESEAKTWATKNLASTWMQYDPVAAKKWVNTLPIQIRQEVEEFINLSVPSQ